MPIAAVVFVKFVADDGSYEWSMRQAGETWLLQESLGVVEGVAAEIEARLAQCWVDLHSVGSSSGTARVDRNSRPATLCV